MLSREKQIERKAGIQLNVASLIIDLTNACTSASVILVTSHDQNIYLHGKLDTVSKMTSESGEQAKDLKNDIPELKESDVKLIGNVHQGKHSFADVPGDHTTSFVAPVKKAIKEIRHSSKICCRPQADSSGENEGEDRIDENRDRRHELNKVVKETNPGSTSKIEIYDFKILGKLGDTNSSRIVPTLTEEDAKLVL